MKKIILLTSILIFFSSVALAEDIWLDAWQQKKSQNPTPGIEIEDPNDVILYQRSQRSPSAYQRKQGINDFFGEDMTGDEYILYERAAEEDELSE